MKATFPKKNSFDMYVFCKYVETKNI